MNPSCKISLYTLFKIKAFLPPRLISLMVGTLLHFHRGIIFSIALIYQSVVDLFWICLEFLKILLITVSKWVKKNINSKYSLESPICQKCHLVLKTRPKISNLISYYNSDWQSLQHTYNYLVTLLLLRIRIRVCCSQKRRSICKW